MTADAVRLPAEEVERMSKITDMVAAEAVDDETEDEDEDESSEPETDDEADDEAETPEAHGPSDADLRKFEAETTRHERALAKIVGDDWQSFEACGVCGGVGHVPAALNADVPFERDPQTEPCSVCKGYGTTLTGAREPGMVTRACSLCQGSGWTTVAEHPEVQPLVALVPATSEAPLENGAPTTPVDPRVAELRAAGYVIVEPFVTAPAPGS